MANFYLKKKRNDGGITVVLNLSILRYSTGTMFHDLEQSPSSGDRWDTLLCWVRWKDLSSITGPSSLEYQMMDKAQNCSNAEDSFYFCKVTTKYIQTILNEDHKRRTERVSHT
jgi:hypothetical protein